MKLTAYLSQWLDAKKTLKPSTYQGYLTNIEKHINPHIGSRQLKEITAVMLETLYDRLSKIRVPCSKPEAKYLSWSSIRYVHATLRTAFYDAVKKRLLSYNPCNGITLPAKNQFRAKILTKEEMQALINGYAASPRWSGSHADASTWSAAR